MTLDELLEENADVLRRMKEEDDPNSVRRQSHNWWNWDIMPLSDSVRAYILNHPEEFKGAGPQ